MFHVFERAWWRKGGNKIVPSTNGRKRSLAWVDTEEEAQAMCRRNNVEREPDWRSIKSEYEPA